MTSEQYRCKIKRNLNVIGLLDMMGGKLPKGIIERQTKFGDAYKLIFKDFYEEEMADESEQSQCELLDYVLEMTEKISGSGCKSMDSVKMAEQCLSELNSLFNGYLESKIKERQLQQEKAKSEWYASAMICPSCSNYSDNRLIDNQSWNCDKCGCTISHP